MKNYLYSNLTTVLSNLCSKAKLFFSFALIALMSRADVLEAQTVVPITTNGTWTVPAGVTSATFYIWGGGGGGGGGTTGTHFANGGGGGGSACGWVTVSVFPGDIYTATIGPGGSAGTPTANGGAGGTTTFTRTTAQSGSTGAAGPWTVLGGAGGTYSTGASNSYFAGGAGSTTGTGTGMAYIAGGNGSEGWDGNSNTYSTTNPYGGIGGGAGGSTNAGSGATTTATTYPCSHGAFAGGTGTYPGGAGGFNSTCASSDQTQTYPGSQPGGGGAGSWSYLTSENGGAGGAGEVIVVYTPAPSLTLSTSTLTFSNNQCITSCSGGTAPSAPQSFTVSGSNFSSSTGNITVSAPSGYQVSTSTAYGATWGSSVNLAYTGSALAATTVYARFVPTSATTYNTSLTTSGGGVASPPSVTVTGAGVSCSSSIYGPDGVNWVGGNQISTGFTQPTNNSGSNFNCKLRYVAVTSGNPTDGRVQWATTLYANTASADVYNTNMNSSSTGFLFTSGGGCSAGGGYGNKWGSGSSFASGTTNTVNATGYQAANNEGLNMSSVGYYTFVMKDAGYATTGYYVGYTTSPPVGIKHTPSTQLSYSCSGLTISTTLSAAPSSESVCVRYKINASSTTAADFSGTNTGTTIAQMTLVSGTTYSYTIPYSSLPAGYYVDYYVFTTTDATMISGGSGITEGDRSYRLINYDDNSGALYSYTVPSTGPTATWIGGATGLWTTATNWSPNVVPCTGSSVVFNTPSAITVTGVPTISLNSISITGTAVTMQPATGGVTVTLSSTGTALSVPSGASLILNPTSGTAANSLTLAYSGSGNTATIGGTLTINPTSAAPATYNTANCTTTISGTLNLTSGGAGAATYIATSGTTSISGTVNINDATSVFTSSSSNTTVTAAGNVKINNAAATIPLATWTSGSPGATVTLTGTATSFTGLGQSFFNVTYNSSSVLTNPSFGGAMTSVAGTLSVLNTNSGTASLLLTTNTALTASIANIVVNGGQLFLTNGTGAATVTVSGNVTVGSTSGSNLFICGNATSQASGTLNITGNLSMSAGEIVNSYGTGNGTLSVTGTTGLSGGTLIGTSGTGTSTYNFAGAVTVNGGTIQMVTTPSGTNSGASIINVTGASNTFTLSSGTLYLLNPTTTSTSVASATFNMTGTSATFTNSGGAIYFNNKNSASGTSSTGSSAIMNLNNYTQSGTGTTIFNNKASGSASGVMNVAGNFSASGSGQMISFYYPNGEVYFNGTSQSITNTLSSTTAMALVSFRVQNGSTSTLSGNFAIGSSGYTNTDSLVVMVGGTLNCGTYSVIDNSSTGGRFYNYGTLGIGSPQGIVSLGTASGNIQTTGLRTFDGTASTSNYTYNGTGAQSTGTGLPTSLAGTLKIANGTSSALITLTNSETIASTGGLNLNSGILMLGANSVTNNGTLTGGSTSSYVLTNSTGSYIVPNSASAISIPIGAGDANVPYYAPLSITGTSASTNLVCSVAGSFVSYSTPTPAAPVTSPNLEMVNLAWSVVSSTATAVSGANVTFGWNSGNDTASFSPSSACDLGVFNGTSYTTTSLGTPSGSNPYSISATGLTIPATGSTNKWCLGNTGFIVAGPTHYNISGQPTTGTTGVAVSTITVQALTAVGAVATGYTGNITLTWVSGNSSSNITGTLTVAAVAGVATFTNVSFNLAGTYVIKATGSLTASSNSSNIVITNPSTNIYGGDGVNWVGYNENPTSYALPTNCVSGDYRDLQYREVATSSSAPTDGRGQWVTTINAQASGGNVYTGSPYSGNMTGGGGDGFIFLSGGGCGNSATFTGNRWNFTGVGQAALNSVNGMNYTSGSSPTGTDMGINMSTPGYYTFVMKDAGYTTTGFYVGYTSAPPVTIQQSSISYCSITGLTITATLSASPSTGEIPYIRYKTNSSSSTAQDFSGTNSGTTILAGTVSGTTVTFNITTGLTAGNYFDYYLFTSTESSTTLNSASEGDKSYSLLNYDDNSHALYSYTIPAAGGTYTWNGGTSGSWVVPGNWTLSGGAPTGTYPTCGSNVVFNTGTTVAVSNVPTVTLASLSVNQSSGSANTSVSLAPAAGAGSATTLSIQNSSSTGLTVSSGCTLTVAPNNASDLLTLNYTGSGNTASIAGTLALTSGSATSYPIYNAANCVTTISGTLNINDANAQITNSSTTALVVTAAGNVNMNNAASAVPTATWTSGSPGATLTFSGTSTATTFTGLASQTFYNVTYEGVATTNPNFGGNLTTVNGALSVFNTDGGVSSLVLTTTTPLTANIANIVVNGGQLFLTDGTAAATVNVTGNVTVGSTSGSNLFISGNATGQGAGLLNITGASSIFSQTGGQTSLVFGTGNGTITMTGASSTFSVTGGSFYMNNGSTGTPTVNIQGATSLFTFSGTALLDFSPTGNTGVVPGQINVAGNLTLAGSGAEIFSSSANNHGTTYNGTINFDGTIGTQTLTATGWTGLTYYTNFNVISGSIVLLASNYKFTNGGNYSTFTVNSGGTLNFGGSYYLSDAATGYGNFTNSGTLIIGHAYGIGANGGSTSTTTGGNVIVAGTRTYNRHPPVTIHIMVQLHRSPVLAFLVL